MERIIPALVKNSDDGFKTMNYNELIPLLIATIQEQQAKIEDLEKVVGEMVNQEGNK